VVNLNITARVLRKQVVVLVHYSKNRRIAPHSNRLTDQL